MGGPEQHDSNHESGPLGDACPSFELLSAFFDDALDEAEARGVGRHAAECPACRAILHELSILQASLKASTPAVSGRVFTLTESDVALPEIAATKGRLIRLDRLYPVVTALAAVLVIALLAGQFLGGGNESGPTAPEAANEVLIIDGTPYSAEDDNAVFSAASTGDMNADDPVVAREAGTSDQDDDGISAAWWIGLMVSAALLIGASAQWYRLRKSPQ